MSNTTNVESIAQGYAGNMVKKIVGRWAERRIRIKILRACGFILLRKAEREAFLDCQERGIYDR